MNPDTGEIVRALAKPKKSTRSLGGLSEDQTVIENLTAGRGLKLDQREELTKVIERQRLPSIDIRIEFAYDSADLNDMAKQAVNHLGQALTKELKGSKVALNGHTDAAGTPEYNQQLSEKRAISVRNYLTSTFGIDGNQLVVAGFGEEKLKNPQEPTARPTGA